MDGRHGVVTRGVAQQNSCCSGSAPQQGLADEGATTGGLGAFEVAPNDPPTPIQVP
jgi:hypothetical protein